MKKLFALVLALALLSSIAFADSILPYTGDPLTWTGYCPELGITEDRESPLYQAYAAVTGPAVIEWSTAPWSDYDTKLATALNTGDLSDVTWARNPRSVVQNYGEMGYFLNYIDYLEYLPNLSNYLETLGQYKQLYSDDGSYYAMVMPQFYDRYDECWWVNKTALNELGLEIPKTWDEMLTAMRAYKEAHPEGLALVTYGWGAGYYEGFIDQVLNAQSVNSYYYDTEAGTWKYSLFEEDARCRDYVDIMHTLYTEGLISPEFSTASNDQMNQYVLEGNWLFGYYYMNTIANEIFLSSEVPFEYEGFVDPVYHEGDKSYHAMTVPYDSLPGWGWFLREDVHDPEVLCAIIDNCISPEMTRMYDFGLEGQTYEIAENGFPRRINGYEDIEKQKEFGIGNLMDLRLTAGGDMLGSYLNYDRPSQVAWNLLSAGLADGSIIKKRAARQQPLFTSDELEEIAVVTNPVSTYVTENVMLFIDGTRPMDEWDAFIDEIRGLGDIQSVIDAYNNCPEQIENDVNAKPISYK